jgi:hypothetical protein
VRLHTGGGADQAARALRANAFTSGPDVVFRQGQLAPQTPAGQKLMAHELAHVVQQVEGTTSAAILRDGDPAAAPAPAAGGEPRVMAPERPAPEPREQTPFRPAGEWFTFRGFSVAADRDFMRGELRRLIARKGIDGADEWIQLLVGRCGRPGGGVPLPFSAHARAYGGLRPRSPLDAMRDVREEQRRSAVAPAAIPLATEVYAEVRREALDFLRTFEQRAIEITGAVLDESQARAESERLRYGLERTVTERTRYRTDEFGVTMPEPEVTVHHRMENTMSARGLAGAAQDLLAKRSEVDALAARRAGLVRTRRMGRDFVAYVPESSRAEHERLGGEIQEKQREYDLLRGTFEDRYPILGRVDDSGLAQIARGSSAATAEVLNEQVYGTFEKIRQVRGELHPGGRVKIWKLPEIVMLTKQATQAGVPTSLGRMRARVVDDKVRQVADDEFWRNLALGALALGLALLAAIPTGGSSLVAAGAALASLGSLGISLYQAGEHLQQYQLEQAMAGSDFDKARALSTEDPSLFWLAVDIVGAIADVGPAVRGARTLMTSGQAAFRALAPAVRRVLTASGPEAAESLAELRRLARAAEAEHGAPGLASRVVHSLERVRGAGGSVERGIAGAAGHEAAAVGRAARELEQSAATGTALARSPARLGGHTVSVTPGGWLVRCTVCGTLREEFAFELARSPDLARRVFAAEDMAARAARTGNRQLAQQAADEARAIADQLEGVRRTRDIRLYRGVRTGSIDDAFLMDRRLVVDMPFVGAGRSGTNAAGWLRDQGYYWEELARRHPDAFSPDNLRRIRGDPPLAGPVSPVNDLQFRTTFPQYDVRGLRGQPLIHHHVGGGGQAAAIPAPLHPGFGGIHNVERGAGIWGGEDPIAEMLQRLLENTTP